MTDAERALAEALLTALGGWYGDNSSFHDSIAAQQAVALRTSGWALVPAAQAEPVNITYVDSDPGDMGEPRSFVSEGVRCLTVPSWDVAAPGMAWARVERALPEGWSFHHLTRLSDGTWNAAADSPQEFNAVCGFGPTPAAALDALAERLEGR